MWTAWTRSLRMIAKLWERKQRYWIRTHHRLPLKAVCLLVSSLGHRQGLHCCPKSLLYIFSAYEVDSPGESHSPSLCTFASCCLFLLSLSADARHETHLDLLCRAPRQESQGSLSSQQFMLFPWWNIFWVFPHSFQRSVPDVRSLLRFLQLLFQSFVQIWLTADTFWLLLETVIEKPDFLVHGWQTVMALFHSGLFHLELCWVRLWEVWFPSPVAGEWRSLVSWSSHPSFFAVTLRGVTGVSTSVRLLCPIVRTTQPLQKEISWNSLEDILL